MCLYARLADHNIGKIDWEPYIPTFFARIQKNFNLPVMYKNTNVGEWFRIKRKPILSSLLNRVLSAWCQCVVNVNRFESAS